MLDSGPPVWNGDRQDGHIEAIHTNLYAWTKTDRDRQTDSQLEDEERQRQTDRQLERQRQADRQLERQTGGGYPQPQRHPAVQCL